jgi:hypothetical protein
VTGAAGVRDHDRDIAEVGTVPDGGLDPDLHRDAGDEKGIDPAVTKSDVQGRALEGRHGDLVEHGLRRERRHLRQDLKTRRVSQEPRLHLIDAADALPGHRHAKLKDAHELLRQGHVAKEEDPDAGVPRNSQRLRDLGRHCVAALDPTQNADLHIVNDQSEAPRVAGLLEILGHLEPVRSLQRVTPLKEIASTPQRHDHRADRDHDTKRHLRRRRRRAT